MWIWGDFARMSVIDSHTGGMPTRVILDGFPKLRGETVAERRQDLERFEPLRYAVVGEPRGSEPMVAALLTAAGRRRSGGWRHLLRSGSGARHVRTRRHRLRTHLARSWPHRRRRPCAAHGRRRHQGALSGGWQGAACQRPQPPPCQKPFSSACRVSVLSPADVAYGGNNFLVVTAPDIPLCQPWEGPDGDRAEDPRQGLPRRIGCGPFGNAWVAHPVGRERPQLRAVSQRHLRPFAGAAPDPAPKSPAWRRTENWRRASFGCRNPSPVRCSPCPMSGWIRAKQVIAPVVIGEAELMGAGDLLLPLEEMPR